MCLEHPTELLKKKSVPLTTFELRVFALIKKAFKLFTF